MPLLAGFELGLFSRIGLQKPIELGLLAPGSAKVIELNAALIELADDRIAASRAAAPPGQLPWRRIARPSAGPAWRVLIAGRPLRRPLGHELGSGFARCVTRQFSFVKTLFIGLVWNRRHLGSAWQGERIGTGEQLRLSELLDEQPFKVLRRWCRGQPT